MKKLLIPFTAFSATFAVIVQFILMVQNNSLPTSEAIVRFFSYFTILSNSLVAIYFCSHSFRLFRQKNPPSFHLGTLTAITIYILLVGLGYQLLLRHLSHLNGMASFVNELLHSLNPLLVLLFWVLNRKTAKLHFQQAWKWSIFPAFYLIFVLTRGKFTGFFPYPFLNAEKFGWTQIFVNCAGLTLVFFLLAFLLVGLSRKSFSSNKSAK